MSANHGGSLSGLRDIIFRDSCGKFMRWRGTKPRHMVGKEADVAPEDTFGRLPKGPLMLSATFPRGVFEASRARSRVTEAELGTCQIKIALLKSKNKIGEKEREIPNHDLAEMKLELARKAMIWVERRLHALLGGTRVFLYGDGSHWAVPKPHPIMKELSDRGKKSKKLLLMD
ncbi:hypothetical protein Tco_0683703 [Tanacetum coccineum]